MAIKFGLVLIGAIMLGACGYQLRTHVPLDGNTSTSQHPNRPALTNAMVNLTVDNHDNFRQILTQKLDLLGIHHNPDTPNRIAVSNIKLQTYKLVGVLTEIRLVLSGDVSYQIHGKTYQTPIQVSRSYQYNEASVTTTDAQAVQVEAWLYDNLASRISEQYYALHTQVPK